MSSGSITHKPPDMNFDPFNLALKVPVTLHPVHMDPSDREICSDRHIMKMKIKYIFTVGS